MSERGQLIVNKLTSCCHNGELDNAEMANIIETVSWYLNLKTLSRYAKDHGITPAGASQRKLDRVTIAGVKLIIDNR